MDFYGRQEEARRASRWLVVAFAIAVLAVIVAIDAVALVLVAGYTQDFALLYPENWFGSSFWTTTLVVGLLVGGPSLAKTAELRSGGYVVARDMGAQRVAPASEEPADRRLVNVVEEMAIASSVPVPAVYVLRTDAVNALTAGILPSSAVIIVTRGALATLDRDELQGVVAHEFSHILNGDMRLNTRLVGFLHGLFIVSEIGRFLGPEGGNGDRGGRFGVAGLAIFMIGLVGLLAGRLLQAAVARQRERLADASAVQFTRQSRGLRNALVKIGAHRFGSRLSHHSVDRVSHMLFAPAGILDFATHPPLAERIRALDPSFRPEEFGRMRRLLDEREAASRGEVPSGPDDVLVAGLAAEPGAISALVGNPGPREVKIAAGIRSAIPAPVHAIATSAAGARALLLALALGDRDQEDRLSYVRLQLGDDIALQVSASLAIARALPLGQRLPVTLLLMGPLRDLEPGERRNLIGVLNGLMVRSGAGSVLGYALRRVAMTFLADAGPQVLPGRPLALRAATEDLRVVLSVVARHGDGAGPDAANAAFGRGWQQLGLPARSWMALPEQWVSPMDRAINRLDRLAPPDKLVVVRALVATVVHDRRINLPEAELLRLLCAVLHCPLPPLLDG